MVKFIAATAVALSAFSSVSYVDACARGMGWATNNNYAKNINNLPLLTWLHHWENLPVPQAASRIQQICMYWGPKKIGMWQDVLTYLKKNEPNPPYIFSFNEPDVDSQSNMDPNYAATLYIEQIQPFADKGTRLGSPAIVWNLEWMSTFLSGIKSKGGHIDFICIHWYGSWNDIDGFKKYVQAAHKLSGKPVWILEMGITTASGPTQQQVKNFMIESVSWLETQNFVERVAWYGGYEISNPPDNYASKYNAFFKPGGALADMAYWYGYTQGNGKRSLHSHHLHRTINDPEEANSTVSDVPPVHCDNICQLRNENMNLLGLA